MEPPGSEKNSPTTTPLDWLDFIYEQGKTLVELHNDALESLRRRQIDPYRAKFTNKKRTRAVVMQLDQIFKKTVRDLGELNEGMMREFEGVKEGAGKRDLSDRKGEELDKVKGESIAEGDEVSATEEVESDDNREEPKDKSDSSSELSDTTVFVSKKVKKEKKIIEESDEVNSVNSPVNSTSPVEQIEQTLSISSSPQSPQSPFTIRTQTPITKSIEKPDSQKPSTSKKSLKLSKEEERARKGVLSSDSEEEKPKPKQKRLRKKKQVDIKTDLKLNSECKVELVKLDKSIERELDAKGFLRIESDSDSDVGVLERAVRDLEKYNAVLTRKNKKSQKKKKLTVKESDSEELIDSDFESVPLIGLKPLHQILETSDLEDLPDIEEEEKIEKRKKKSSSDKRQKTYITPIIDSDSSSTSSKISLSSKSSSIVIKRNPVGSSSDSSSDFIRKKRKKPDSSDSEEKKKKKRKRIKEENTSTDSDIEEVDRVQGGRKKIRSIIKDEDLKKNTKLAEKEEEERRRRVKERQEEFNGIFDIQEEQGTISRLPLEINPTTKEVLIEVDESIVKKLKPHQIKGIKFMYTTCYESLEMIEKGKAGGCILAHCMGLGKTLQTVAFTTTVLQSPLTKTKKILIVCPLNTVTNWLKEYQMWTDELPEKPKLHPLYDGKNLSARIENLKIFDRRGGIGIIHYDMFRNLVHTATGKTKSKTVTSKQKEIIRNILLENIDLIVCDEGHLLKNHKSKLSMSLTQIKTNRRVVLTGTPLQNNLVEYHTMVDFVKPNLLGSLKEFQNRFVHPIRNGQCSDSSERDVKIMKRRAHVLHSKLDGCVQRLDYSELTPYLPPKYEYCLIIKLSDKQKELYQDYIENVVPTDKESRAKQLLPHYAVLVKILAHPVVLSLKKNFEKSDEEGSLKDFINDDDSKSDTDSDIECLDLPRKSTRSNPIDDDSKSPSSPIIPVQWWSHHFEKKEDMYDMTLSGKLIVLQQILKTCETIGDRVLVFSQYLTTLDIIEEFLKEWDENEGSGRWRSGIEYFRIDGGTKSDVRQRSCDVFNAEGRRAKLFLISTRAGGLGINLFGANRVIIFDASWNPSNDMQSIFRVYRFGQQKPCYIYRFVAEATMEEKIYNRQVVKLSLSSRVIDEHQVERHFKFDDITEMYKFDPNEVIERKTVPVPKDRLLADLLISQKDWISTYFEHDTLLINKEDETLTEEERKQAWDEYTNENERVVPPPVQIQDQATFMKIKMKLREKFPHAMEVQIDTSAVIVLQKVQELRNLLQKVNFERGKLGVVELGVLEGKIGRIQKWISEALKTEGGFGNSVVGNYGNYGNSYPANNNVRRVDATQMASIQRGMFEGLQMARAMNVGSDSRARVGVTGSLTGSGVQIRPSWIEEAVTLD